MNRVVAPTASPLLPDDQSYSDEPDFQIVYDQAKQAWLDRQHRRSGKINTHQAYALSLQQFENWSPVPLWKVTPTVAETWAQELEQGQMPTYTDVVIVNIRTGKIHHPLCRMIPTKPYRLTFATCEQAELAGYKVCTLCAPQLGYGKALAPASINQKLAALSSFYDFFKNYTFTAPSGQVITLWPPERGNPFAGVKRAAVGMYERATYPTYEEVLAILTACNRATQTGLRDFTLLYTFVVTCRRSTEILNLRWGDIEPAEEGNFKFRYQAKGGKVRWAPMRREVHQVLVDYLKAVDRWPSDANAYVFQPLAPERATRLGHTVTYSNQPLSNSQVNRILKKYGRQAGIDQAKCHVHGLRHAGVRRRYQEAKRQGEADLLELSHFLGHSNVATTQIYSQELLTDPPDPAGRLVVLAFRPQKAQHQRNQSI